MTISRRIVVPDPGYSKFHPVIQKTRYLVHFLAIGFDFLSNEDWKPFSKYLWPRSFCGMPKKSGCCARNLPFLVKQP